MSATPDSTLADPQPARLDLQQQLAEIQRLLDQRTAERDEAQQRLVECTAERDEGLAPERLQPLRCCRSSMPRRAISARLQAWFDRANLSYGRKMSGGANGIPSGGPPARSCEMGIALGRKRICVAKQPTAISRLRPPRHEITSVGVPIVVMAIVRQSSRLHYAGPELLCRDFPGTSPEKRYYSTLPICVHISRRLKRFCEGLSWSWSCMTCSTSRASAI